MPPDASPAPSGSQPPPSAAPISRCRVCGAANRAYGTFCLACGEPLTDDAPGPAAGAGDGGRRSRGLTILAMLLAGAVLGGLLLNWYGDETRAASYRGGVAAAAAYDWSTAATRFQSAGAFRDAPVRAVQAEANARQRAALAHSVEYAGLAQNWKEVLVALGRLLPLDPTDSGAQAQRKYARDRFLDRELQGTLYLVATGANAGLYANLAAGRDIRLPGSDGESRPRAWSADGRRLVYDRPRLHAGETLPGGSGQRESVLATFPAPDSAAAGTPAAAITLTVLPPLITPTAGGLFLPGGLLWQTYPRDVGLSNYLLTYYRFADGSTVPITSSGEWRYVAAASPATGQLLLVEPPPPAGPELSRIMVTPPGGRPSFDIQERGGLRDAAFSADGRYLFCAIQEGTGATSLTRSLFILRLGAPVPAPGPPSAGWQFLRSITSGPRVTPPDLAAEFVPAGSDATRYVLLTTREGPDISFTLHRLADDDETLIWSGPAPEGITRQVLADNGAWLAYMAGDPAGPHLVVQGLSAGTPPLTLASAGFRGGDTTLAFAPGGAYLVYGTPGPEHGAPGALYTLALARSDMSPSGTPALQPLYLGTAQADGDAPALALPPGGQVVLYIDTQHTLHAVTYDNAVDLPLPGRVAGVWSLR